MIIQGMLWCAAAHEAYLGSMLGLSVYEAWQALSRKWGKGCLISVGPGYWMAEIQTSNSIHLVCQPTVWALDERMSELGWQPRGTADEWQQVAAIFKPRVP